MTTHEIEQRGYFWWADEPVLDGHFAPANAVTGVLKVGTDGATKLVLDDTLPRVPGKPNLDPGANPATEPEFAVVGLIKNGREHVRLEQLSNVAFSLGSAQKTSETLKARLCLRGNRLVADSPPNCYCTSMRVSLAGFEQWLQLEYPQLTKSSTELVVRMPKPGSREIQLDYATMTIGVEVSYHSENPLIEAVLRQEGYLIYTPSSPMTLDDVRDVMHNVEDLLVLLTDCERTLGFPQVQVNANEDWHQVTYQILQRRKTEVSRSDLWTIFPQLSPDFGDIMKKWLAKLSKFGPGFHLYLGNRRGVQLYVEHRFANLVWGLEAFHRITDNTTSNIPMSEKTQRILSAVDTKDRRWLRGVLKRLGEPSLAQRIFEVLVALPLGFSKVELTKFANQCAMQRNSISHYGGRRQGADYAECIIQWDLLSSALDVLYHARILQELGFKEVELRRIFFDMSPGHRIRNVLALNGLNLSA